VVDVAVLVVVEDEDEDEDGYGYDVVRRLRAAGLECAPSPRRAAWCRASCKLFRQ
jgi:hypothetical protein